MKINKTKINISPDANRVLLRPFNPGSELRIKKIINRILSLPGAALEDELNHVMDEFENRHRNINKYFLARFDQLRSLIEGRKSFTRNEKLLIGSYFSMEYSPESASLFNPSIVWHPDQSNLTAGEKRFILSLRATGEGHISSIVFITGIIDEKNAISLDERSKFITNPEKINDYLPSAKNLIYEIKYSKDVPLPERIIFPYSPLESNGIEDARLVQFHNKNGTAVYYAPYTAYDGKKITSQILQTSDFLDFKIFKLNGKEIMNKGMALFPGKINNKYAIISRQDNENIFIMLSQDLYNWDSKKILLEPKYPWEFVQLGNCGSPIEIDEGWLVLSHGVGAMRIYTIGTFLLDKNDPSKVIGRLNKPLLIANKNERGGYVPNVVYSCGSVVNNGELIIPYAMSDCASSFAKVNLGELLNKLKSNA